MSLKLPPADSKLRELFDVQTLADRTATLELRAKLPTVKDARISAANELRAGNIKSLTYIVLRANGDVALVRFARGRSKAECGETIFETMRELWNFGQ